LRLLAARRMTEAQLWSRLTDRGFDDGEVRDAVAFCKREGYVDDALFARLFVEGRRRAVGDARLVGELVKRGVDREAAVRSVAGAETDEDARLAGALDRIFRARPGVGYPGAARALERLGFPASAIYRHLRLHASRFGPFADPTEDQGTPAT
jgi:SOS response regulatory protein OraA/RecX